MPNNQQTVSNDSQHKVDAGNFRMLGIDPGFGRTGLGVVDFSKNKIFHVWHTCIDTPSDAPFTDRLQTVRNDIMEAIRRFQPNVAAVEQLFFQTNVKTAINVGMARGVILLTLADASLPVVELTPNQVKQSVAGHGGADKKQIQAMVKKILRLNEIPKPDDAADALAIAISGGYIFQTKSRQNA
ncbi:crossover junction endodeoxyribonuclease RuvC [Patescibacteria group bacterium]|nr:crossover junction endodeoxyribonuclease RuvC [Patescibacteria group bacterium]